MTMRVSRQNCRRVTGCLKPCRGPLPASVWVDTVIRPTAPDMSTIAVMPLTMASPMLKRPCPSAGELMRSKKVQTERARGRLGLRAKVLA